MSKLEDDQTLHGEMRPMLHAFLSRCAHEVPDRANPITIQPAACPVRVLFSDSQLRATYLPALAHHAQQPSLNPSLTITVCGYRTHPFHADLNRLIQPPGTLSSIRHTSPIYFFKQSGALISMHVDRARIAALFYYEPEAQRACAWLNQHAEPMSCAAPLRALFAWHLEARGMTLLHAGAAGNDEGGVLFIGQSGSGKSSCALSAVGPDIQIAGDDTVALSSGMEPLVHSMYCSARIVHRDLERYGFSAAESGSALKSIRYLDRNTRYRMIKAFPVRALIFPVILGGETRIEELKKIEALRSLSASNIFHVPGRDIAASFKVLAGLTDHLPAYQLRLGNNRSELNPLLTDFIHRTNKRRN